jgi:cobalt-zinc-cadmium efflux system outer membrane protein
MMSRAARAGAVLLTFLAVGCASVPKDGGFADVKRTVAEETGQPIEWDPSRPVAAPDDAAIAALLQNDLTADDAVRIAFAHNRDVQATLEELGIARADLIGASTIRNPILDGEIRFPGDPRSPFELGLSQSLMDLLRLGSRRKLGRARFEVARVRVSAAVINFATEVRARYYDLLAARQVLARQGTTTKAQELATELARRQHAAGNISDLDLEIEQARYEQVKLDYARAQLDELQAREHLTANLGLVQRADLKLPDAFPEPPAQEMSEDEVLTQVMARRLDVRLAQREIEAAQRALGLSSTAVFDDVEIGAHLEREPEGKKTAGPAVSVPIPMFNRGASQKARARAMLRQAQQRLAALTSSARSEARAARERLAEARSRALYIRDVVVPRRDRILKLTQLEYNAMLRGVFQLIEARQDLATAQREEALATRDYWIARTELDAALLGVSGFTVRRDAAEKPQPQLFPAMAPRESRENE